MADITLGGKAIQTSGILPENNISAPDFKLVTTDLSEVSLKDFAGNKLILNIFPSIDTGTCAASVRKFNERASGLDNTKVLCISRDLPFAQKRFCGAEGLDNVLCLSDFKEGKFGETYGLTIDNGPLAGLHSRAIVVIDETGTIKYSEQVNEIADEPDYDKALAAIL